MRLLAFAIAVPLLAASVAGLKWTAPSTWKTQGERPMRAATYTLPPAPGGSGAAECAVYFFGTGQGGSVEANLERWKGQILSPAGKPANATVQKRTIHGMPVTTIDSSGSYEGMGDKSAATNHRLLGAIVEGPGGNVFIKCTGPAKTISANQPQFDQLLGSFEKEK